MCVRWGGVHVYACMYTVCTCVQVRIIALLYALLTNEENHVNERRKFGFKSQIISMDKDV